MKHSASPLKVLGTVFMCNVLCIQNVAVAFVMILRANCFFSVKWKTVTMKASMDIKAINTWGSTPSNMRFSTPLHKRSSNLPKMAKKSPICSTCRGTSFWFLTWEGTQTVNLNKNTHKVQEKPPAGSVLGLLRSTLTFWWIHSVKKEIMTGDTLKWNQSCHAGETALHPFCLRALECYNRVNHLWNGPTGAFVSME